MMQKYSELIRSSFDDHKTKEPKTSNNRIHTAESSKSCFYSTLMRKQGVYLDHNIFYADLCEKLKVIMQKLVYVDFKEHIIETIEEMGRAGNFICIYPIKGCCQYDKYFVNQKPVNKAVYDCLYTDHVFDSKLLFDENEKIPN